MSKKIVTMLIAVLLVSLVPFANAAPTSTIYFPEGQVSSIDNVVQEGKTELVTITFWNDAGAALTDVASTIQYITVAAADTNPSRATIMLNATWEIWNASKLRASGDVDGLVDTNAIYAPYSTTLPVYLYNWTLGAPNGTLDGYTNSNQFNDGLKVLRPGEVLNVTITIECHAVGDSRIWFFFQATEFKPTSVPVTSLSTIPLDERANIYYQNVAIPSRPAGWWPLHNSYDPYDLDIGTGHAFEQVGKSPEYGWTRIPTTTRFAKANKLVHQKPSENPGGDGAATYSFHICGFKFDDMNRDGVFNASAEHGIGLYNQTLLTWIERGVIVKLLGPDALTNATGPGGSYPELTAEHEPWIETGENGLRGAYCFNLEGASSTGGVDDLGTYVFYVNVTEPPGRLATTPTSIGPITLYASVAGPRESLNNNFGNALAEISGSKFYDANVNGLWEKGPSEPYIEGFKIVISNTTWSSGPLYTNSSGMYSYYGLYPGEYNVTEYLPNAVCKWVNTTATRIEVTVTAGELSVNNDFGNVCLGAGGGLTPGYWSNKNGQAKMNDNGGSATELSLLSGLNLRKKDGGNFDPANYNDFKNWLLKADAVNMAYMLSVQLAAMELNVEAGFVSGSAMVYAPGTQGANAAGFISITALMNEANAELGLHGSTPAGSPYRDYQELLKNALDQANNNMIFVQDHPCTFTWPY